MGRTLFMILVYLSSCESAEKQTGMTSEAKQKEVARNIILLEKSNCNYRLTEIECLYLQLHSKWKYIKTFLTGFRCKRGAKMDLQVPEFDPASYDVKCPGPVRGRRPARVYHLLTDSYLNKMGIVFRNGKMIAVPGEGIRPVSENWDNGTEDQRIYREEIGNNICQWSSSPPGPSPFCMFRKKKCRCMLILAKIYYVATYSPTGWLNDYCDIGEMFDLHIPSQCKARCPLPDYRVGYAEYAFTNQNMYKVPSICKRRSSWITKIGKGL